MLKVLELKTLPLIFSGPLEVLTRLQISVGKSVLTVCTCCLSRPFDQSESVFQLFLVTQWLNLLPFLVSYGSRGTPGVLGREASVPLSAFLRTEGKSASADMAKQLHYPVSYYLKSFSFCHWLTKRGNFKPASINTSRLPKKQRIGKHIVQVAKEGQRPIKI